ncbi:MAG: DUF4142 domain-containing protein, partial [Cyclobacteriaceae bacterium]|nr:DUF4142 domain-containing protein [Cyclobacteriaceae bacterium]
TNKMIMRKLGILTIITAMMWTAGIAQTDSTTHERKQKESYSEKSQDETKSWKKDKSVDANQTIGEDISAEAKDFIRTAAESSSLEMQLAQVALQKEDVPQEIREYGQKIVEDHATANRELQGITQNFQADVPDAMNPQSDIPDERQEEINEFRDIQGDEFHESFISRMIEEHQTLIQKFEKAKSGIDNEQLSNWIDNTLPALKDHLDTAKDLQAKIENGELENAEEDTDEGIFEDR